jgi:pimeloyl-ACP methyl ester carboxylesterase
VAVLDELGLERAVLAGASMGAHTIVRLALDHGDRVAGVVLITPAYTPDGEHTDLARWDALADGLRDGGVEGFVQAYGDPGVPEAWRETVIKVVRQRLSAHQHPEAVADALRAVPRSRAFEDWAELGELELPAVVVASRDEADPGHPLDIGETYAELLPRGQLLVEQPGQSPLAWQGGCLSKVVADLAAQAW